jgi:triosephosphate isomerase (TIM)
MRKKVIIANWKMNKTNEQAAHYIKELRHKLHAVHDKEIVVCPSFVSIITCFDCARGSNIQVGAQDIHHLKSGAYTGEVSAEMISEFCSHVIVGHSERRAMGEKDEDVNRKVKAAIQEGLIPIVCIGETLEQRKAKKTMQVLRSQLEKALQGVSNIDKLIIAYEPVWAISGGHASHEPATPDAAEKEHKHIRSLIELLYPGHGAKIRIVYGGSVKAENAKGFLHKADIDGCLVGNASLDVDSFARIAH